MALPPTCGPGRYSHRQAMHSPSVPQGLGSLSPGVSPASFSPTHTMPRTRWDVAQGCGSSLRPGLMPPRGQASAVQRKEDKWPPDPAARVQPRRQRGARRAVSWGRVALCRPQRWPPLDLHVAPVSAPTTPRVPGSVCFRSFPGRGLRM